MGLDMYLMKIKREAIPYIDVDPDEAKSSDPALYEKMKSYLILRGEPRIFQWESVFDEVGYWRKANQIHNWFVENAQGGEDDCGYYEVTPGQLATLRDKCMKVALQSVMMPGRINNGYTFDGTSAMVPIVQVGKTVINPEVAQELLPTQGGFFFGSTDYDEYYMEDITGSIEILNKVLAETDFSTHAIYYTSSW